MVAWDSQAYELCDEAQGIRTLNAVLNMGYDHLDTAALYGFGKNEELLNKAIGHRRSEYPWRRSAGCTVTLAVSERLTVAQRS